MRWVLASLAALAVIGVLWTCASRDALDPPEATPVPRLDPVLQRILTDEDSLALVTYSRERGQVALTDALGVFYPELCGDTAAEVDSARSRYLPAIGALGRRLLEDNRARIYYDDYLFWSALSSVEALQCARLHADAREIRGYAGRTDSARVAALLSCAAELRDLGERRVLLEIYSDLVRNYSRMDSLEMALSTAQLQLRTAEEAGSPVMMCSALAYLVALYGGAGPADSVTASLDRWEQVATTHRLPVQTARLLLFRSRDMMSQGRFAAAVAYFEESIRIHRSAEGSVQEVRPRVELAEVLAGLGAWSRVESLLRECRILLKEASGTSDRRYLAFYTDAVTMLQVEADLARGATEGVEEALRPVLHSGKEDPERQAYCRAVWTLTEALLAVDRPARVPELADEGRSWARRYNFPDFERAFCFQKAKALARQGNWSEALRVLAEFDQLMQVELMTVPDAPVDLRFAVPIERDVLLARAALAEGRRPDASGALVDAVRLVASRSQRSDQSQESQLDISTLVPELHAALHEFVGSDAETGYRLEMAWRLYLPLAGGHHHPWAGPVARGALDDLIEILESGGEGTQIRSPLELPGPETTHWLYAAAPGGLVRWTATQSGVERELLPIASADLDSWVRDAYDGLAHPGASGSQVPVPQEALERLFSALCGPLPAPGSLVLVTPTGSLTRIPFEAFDMDPGPGYHPLLADFDVAYLRFAAPSLTPAASGPPVLVVDPVIAPSLRLRFPFLKPLPGAQEEGRRVAASLGHARVLRSAGATKPALLDLWENTPLLYVAAHTMRDPETEYLSFLPLAPSAGHDSPEAILLEASEIRRADLSRVRLVVISSCASGAGYVSSTSAAPSLGDAFLEAGASAVIQTFWSASDNEAIHLHRLRPIEQPEWRHAHIPSTSKARRRLLEDGLGVSIWSNYALYLGRPDPLRPTRAE